MRFGRLGERIEEELYLLVLVLLVDVAREAIVAASDQLRGRLDRVLAQMFLQQFVRNASPPKLIRFRLILWPRRFLPAQLNLCIALEINRLFQQFFDLSDTLVHPSCIEIINLVSGFKCAEENVACK